MGSAASTRTTIGWREWVALPDWGVAHVKAKIDTGARTSALHAFAVERFDRDGEPWIRFAVHPWQRSGADETIVEAPLVDRREVRSSSGTEQVRPVVRTTIDVGGRPVAAEVSLTRRDAMGFRMLIGREALRNRFVVDPARSFVGGRPERSVRERNRASS